MVQYLDIIQDHNYEEIDRLIQLQDELSIVSTTLASQRQEAEEERDRAAEALAEAEAAREEARQAALARAFAEAQQRQAAVEEARAHEGETFTTASGNEAQVQAPASDDVTNGASSQEQQQQQQQESAPEQPSEPTPAAPTVDSREQYISTWAARIDAFNAGWPLAGYGRTFAEAAYDYGVDPRWSPAIARLESSSGTYCFASHNAWGWGDVDWPDWDTAIRSHVRGLANGYGYTLTWDAAQTYCPPNASYWYSVVSSCMYEIWGSDSL